MHTPATDLLIESLRIPCPGLRLEADDRGRVRLLYDGEIGVTAAPLGDEHLCLAWTALRGERAACDHGSPAGWTDVERTDGDFTWSAQIDEAAHAMTFTAIASLSQLDTVSCRRWLEAFVDWCKAAGDPDFHSTLPAGPP